VHLLPLQPRLSWQMTRAELQDMLLIAVNLEREWLSLRILHHDSEHKTLLHANAAAAPSSSSSSSTAAQLVEQLITTAVIRGHKVVALRLAATPAAEQLSTQQVTQLLYMCIQLEQPQQGELAAQAAIWDDDAESVARRCSVLPCFKALWALPSAQSIRASTVADMMQLAAQQQQQRLWLGKQLCELPAAQQVSPRELCEVLVYMLEHTGTAGTPHWLMRQLLNLPAAQQLPQGAAKQLLQRLIDTCAVCPTAAALDCMAALQLGSQLTGGEVLQLLQQAASKGAIELLCFIAELKPAADEIDDTHGCAAVLLAVLQHALLPNEGSSSSSSHSACCGLLLALPAVQQLPADAVASVLAAAVNAGNVYAVKRMCALDEAAEFSLAAAASLLQLAAQKGYKTWFAVLQGPAVSQLDQQACENLVPKAVQRVQPAETYSAVYSERAASIVLSNLLQQPAVQQLDTAAAVRLMPACLKLQPSQPLWMLQQLRSQLSSAQQALLESEPVKQLMHTAFVTRAWDSLDWLRALPAALMDDEKVRLWCDVGALEHLK
jgi:hypothetical protein